MSQISGPVWQQYKKQNNVEKFIQYKLHWSTKCSQIFILERKNSVPMNIVKETVTFVHLLNQNVNIMLSKGNKPNIGIMLTKIT
jgi:hypothetical protein